MEKGGENKWLEKRRHNYSSHKSVRKEHPKRILRPWLFGLCTISQVCSYWRDPELLQDEQLTIITNNVIDRYICLLVVPPQSWTSALVFSWNLCHRRAPEKKLMPTKIHQGCKERNKLEGRLGRRWDIVAFTKVAVEHIKPRHRKDYDGIKIKLTYLFETTVTHMALEAVRPEYNCHKVTME